MTTKRTTKSVACLGLGGMGGGIAGRLCDLGWAPVLYNRSPDKAAALAGRAAAVAATPAEAAAGADVILLSVSDESAVDSVLFGVDGVVSTLRQGAVVIDMSTVSPGYSRRVTERLAGHGLRRVEATLIGNPIQARAGEARAFAGGAPDDIDAVRDVLTAIGQGLFEVGPMGTACTLKLVFNALLGSQIAALAEAVSYGARAGLDQDQVLNIIAQSGFSSLVMSFRCQVMREQRYRPATFRSVLMEKDLRLAVTAADEHGVSLPVIDAAARRFTDLVAAGAGELDAAAIFALQLADHGGRAEQGAARVVDSASNGARQHGSNGSPTESGSALWNWGG